jgi:hypothetical protein
MDNSMHFGTPQGGNYIAANGRVYNMVDLLGGGTPINDQVYDVRQFAPKCGLVLGSDGRVYDLTALLLACGSRAGVPVETELKTYTPTAEETRLRLLRESDAAMAIDRLGLTVSEGTTFKAWEPFLTALGNALTGEVATYRQALLALPTHPNWPDLLPEDWPKAPDALTKE